MDYRPPELYSVIVIVSPHPGLLILAMRAGAGHYAFVLYKEFFMILVKAKSYWCIATVPRSSQLYSYGVVWRSQTLGFGRLRQTSYGDLCNKLQCRHGTTQFHLAICNENVPLFITREQSNSTFGLCTFIKVCCVCTHAQCVRVMKEAYGWWLRN